MRTLVLIAALATGATAHAQERHASEVQELYFEDTYEVFSVLTFDTGQLPSAGDPITIRFHITPTGGVVSGMEAESHLEWPNLEHQVVGNQDSGFLAVDSEIEIAAEVGIDIFGLWTGTIDLWSEYVDLYQASTFDPLLVGGSPASVVLAGDGLIDPLEFEITVFTGLDVVVAVDIYPSLAAQLAGTRVETTHASGTIAQTMDGEWVSLPAPTDSSGTLELDVAYVGDLTSMLDLTIEPSVSLDTFLGGFQLVSFPIDVPLVDLTLERVFPAAPADHPMPVIGPLPSSLDAGELPVGGLVNLPVSVENWGAMPLEGTARIVGSNDFSVFPEQIFLPPGGSGGVMVSFGPVLDGAREVILEVETNDPAVPLVRIPVRGVGLALDAAPDDGPPTDQDMANVNGEEVKAAGCGCQTGPAPSGGWLALLGLVFLRRGPTW